MSVDFPEPLGPMTATFSPRSIARLMPSRACLPSRDTVMLWNRSSELPDMELIERGGILHGGKIAQRIAQVFPPDQAANNFAALRFGKLADREDGAGTKRWP